MDQVTRGSVPSIHGVRGQADEQPRLLEHPRPEHGTIVIGAGLALTGIGMIAVLGPRMLQQPWLLVSLATYAVVAVVAFAVQRPQLQRLQARDGIQTDADRAAWRDRARRQRYMAYGLTSAVGLIGFLMSTKPQLW